jgi:hypothetical protein
LTIHTSSSLEKTIRPETAVRSMVAEGVAAPSVGVAVTAADRVVSLADGALTTDGDPTGWPLHAPTIRTRAREVVRMRA